MRKQYKTVQSQMKSKLYPSSLMSIAAGASVGDRGCGGDPAAYTVYIYML